MKTTHLVKPFRLFASCPRYVEDLLEEEIKALGGTGIKKTTAGVSFLGDLAVAYRVCYCSRTASRVVLNLCEFKAETPEDVYRGTATVSWEDHLTPDQSFAVDCTLKKGMLTNQNYSALVVKDGIADYFRDKTGKRPSVDTTSPDLRIHLHIHKTDAVLSLDLSGESLHKRGYRIAGSKASLKENTAAALLLRAGWPEMAGHNIPFIDPMCGSGTLLIEGFMIAANIPAGRFREDYGFLRWKQHQPGLWEKVMREANKESRREKAGSFIGYDFSGTAVRAARANIRQAGLTSYIQVEKRDISKVSPPTGTVSSTGLVSVNPPYGVRLGGNTDLRGLYNQLGKILVTYFKGWKAAVLSFNQELSHALGIRAVKTNYLYNGPLKCLLTCFELEEEWIFHTYSPPACEPDEALVNRLKKNLKRLGKWARRNHISCYRLYDADLPEYAAAVDYFEGKYLHIQEYAPPPTVEKKKAEQRLREIVCATGRLLGVEEDLIFVKQRRRQKGASQYMRRDHTNKFYIINEGNLSFRLNFTDYLDPGIFLLARNLRGYIRNHTRGMRFLNLFAYTGTATVSAAAGGAVSTLSVDTSHRYLSWAKENMAINGFSGNSHQFIQEDCLTWLKESPEEFDLIYCDPPTFSNTKKKQRVFDLQKQHLPLITMCMDHLNEDGILIFSNSFKGFKLDLPALSGYRVTDLHAGTLPEDFKRRSSMYHCWKIEFLL